MLTEDYNIPYPSKNYRPVMKELTLQSHKSNFYSNTLRIFFGVLGLIYLVPALLEFFNSYEITTFTIINGLLGLFILAVVVFSPTFGANIKLTLNEKFMRSEEDMSMVRTAHWNKIGRITLTRFSIRLKYKSGTPERFRLPFVSSEEHRELKEWLVKISEEYDIPFLEKAWWKPF